MEELGGDTFYALGWSLLTRTGVWTRYEGDGMGDTLVGGDLESLAEAFGSAYRMLKRGWSLFDNAVVNSSTSFLQELSPL